jgi:hypothetical protein
MASGRESRIPPIGDLTRGVPAPGGTWPDPETSSGETTQAGALFVFDNFASVKRDFGSCSLAFMAEIARALGERYEPV